MKATNTKGADDKKPKGFHLRMPPELRKRIDDAIKLNGRSVNAELVTRIEASFDADKPDLVEVIRSLKASIDSLNKRLDEK